VLARLAGVVVFLEDTGTRSNAGREMTTAVTTVDIIVVNLGIAVSLRAVVLLLRHVDGRSSGEQLDSKCFVLFSFSLRDFRKSLQLHKGLRALTIAFVEEAGQSNNAVNLLGAELLLVLDEPHGSFHSACVLFLIHLSLAQQEEMDRFSTLPRISQSFICTGADVGRDQRVHRFGCDVCCRLPSVCNLGNLRVEHSLLVRVHLKRSKNVYLLDEQERSILLSHFKGYLGKQPGGICVFICLTEQFNRLDLLVLLDQMTRIALKKLLDLNKVVLLGQLNCLIPLVQENTAIDSALYVTKFDKGGYSSCTQTHGLESLTKIFQDR